MLQNNLHFCSNLILLMDIVSRGVIKHDIKLYVEKNNILKNSI